MNCINAGPPHIHCTSGVEHGQSNHGADPQRAPQAAQALRAAQACSGAWDPAHESGKAQVQSAQYVAALAASLQRTRLHEPAHSAARAGAIARTRARAACPRCLSPLPLSRGRHRMQRQLGQPRGAQRLRG